MSQQATIIILKARTHGALSIVSIANLYQVSNETNYWVLQKLVNQPTIRRVAARESTLLRSPQKRMPDRRLLVNGMIYEKKIYHH